MKIKDQINIINSKIFNTSKEIEVLNAYIVNMYKTKEKIQHVCNHKNKILHNIEAGSGKHVYICTECEYIGYHTDFK